MGILAKKAKPYHLLLPNISVFCIACKCILSLTGSRHSFHTVVDCIHVAIHPHLDSFDPILSQTSTRTILAEVSRPCHACFMPSLPLRMTHILVNSQSFSLLHLLLTAHPREQTDQTLPRMIVVWCACFQVDENLTVFRFVHFSLFSRGPYSSSLLVELRKSKGTLMRCVKKTLLDCTSWGYEEHLWYVTCCGSVSMFLRKWAPKNQRPVLILNVQHALSLSVFFCSTV